MFHCLLQLSEDNKEVAKHEVILYKLRYLYNQGLIIKIRALQYLAGLLYGAAWHLHGVFGKEVIQDLDFHALLMANWATDHVHC